MSDKVNHPSHYNTGKFEVIDVIEDWKLGFALGNAVKYIARADHKGNNVEDLRKAAWYINREIARLEGEVEKPEPESMWKPTRKTKIGDFYKNNIFAIPVEISLSPLQHAAIQRIVKEANRRKKYGVFVELEPNGCSTYLDAQVPYGEIWQIERGSEPPKGWRKIGWFGDKYSGFGSGMDVDLTEWEEMTLLKYVKEAKEGGQYGITLVRRNNNSEIFTSSSVPYGEIWMMTS